MTAKFFKSETFKRDVKIEWVSEETEIKNVEFKYLSPDDAHAHFDKHDYEGIADLIIDWESCLDADGDEVEATPEVIQLLVSHQQGKDAFVSVYMNAIQGLDTKNYLASQQAGYRLHVQKLAAQQKQIKKKKKSGKVSKRKG